MTSWTTVVLILGVTTGIKSNEIIQGPVNTAATYGINNVELSCKVHTPSDYMEWKEFITNAQGTRIYSTHDDVILDDRFDIYRSGPDGNGHEDIHLIVKEVTQELGGRYQCGLILTTVPPANAELVTISPMTCSPDPGEQTIDEGDIAYVSCNVDYQGYEAPFLDLVDPSGSRLDGFVASSTDKHSESTANFTASGTHDMMELTCLLSFTQAESPEFTDNCTTFLHVNHPAGGIGFSPSSDDFPDGIIERYVGEEVNCTADGRPEPDFTWFMSGNEIPNTGATLVTDDSMLGTREYTCLAKNTFKGEERETSRMVLIEVQGTTTSAVTSGPEPATTSTTHGSCGDITGQWKDPISGARLVLMQAPDTLITGTYSDGLDSGWFTLNGQRAHTQNTFGFIVIGQSGLTATSFTGECRECGPDTLYTKAVTYNQDEHGCTKEGSGGSPGITAIEQYFRRE